VGIREISPHVQPDAIVNITNPFLELILKKLTEKREKRERKERERKKEMAATPFWLSPGKK